MSPRREVTSIKPSGGGTKDFATVLCHDQEFHLLLCWGILLLQQQELAVFAQNVISLGAQNRSPWNIGKAWERGGDECGPLSHNYKPQHFCLLKQVIPL